MLYKTKQSNYATYRMNIYSLGIINNIQKRTMKEGIHLMISCLANTLLPILIYSMLSNHHSNQSTISTFQLPQNLQPFLYHDARHLFHNQYQYQPQHAFFPAYVSLLQLLRLQFTDQFAILIMLLLNNAMFCISAYQLRAIYMWYLHTKDSTFKQEINNQKSSLVVLMFAYNPASIFFHNLYTQSLYCFVTFIAIRYFLEYYQSFQPNTASKLLKSYEIQFVEKLIIKEKFQYQCKDRYKQKCQNSDIQFCEILFLLLLFVAGFIRSNSIFLSPIIGLPILYRLFFVKTSGIYNFMCQRLKHFLKGAIILLILLFPFFFHLYFSTNNICSNTNMNYVLNNKGQKYFYYSRAFDLSSIYISYDKVLLVCSQHFGNIYAQIQKKYWNVGFLAYFTFNNLGFILIGLPALFASICSFIYFIKSSHKSIFKNIKVLGLFASFLLLFIVILFMTNIQSSTRFLCTHPLFYILIAEQLFQYKLVRIIWILYAFAGIFFYSVGFPWT